MQDDSLDKITSPSLEHNVDATKLKGTREKQQSKISQGKKNYSCIYRQKMTGYFACLQSYIFRAGTCFISFYSTMFRVSLNPSSEGSLVYPAIVRVFEDWSGKDLRKGSDISRCMRYSSWPKTGRTTIYQRQVINSVSTKNKILQGSQLWPRSRLKDQE